MASPDRPFTKFILRNIDKKHNGFFIEAGANTGIERSVCYSLEKDYNWKGINIEPNPYCFEELVKSRPDSINLDCALFNKEGEFDFSFEKGLRRGVFTGSGSIVRPSGTPMEVFKVKTRLLKNVLKEHGITEVDLLILDVEGAEIEALEGMVGGPMPRYICVEDNTVTSVEDIVLFADKHGYSKVSSFKCNTLFKRK